LYNRLTAATNFWNPAPQEGATRLVGIADNPARLPLVAGILAGGMSRRIGRPKALLPLASGRLLIEHVAEVAGTLAEDVVILGQACRLPAALDGLRVLKDVVPGAGPIAGLASLLEYAQERWTWLLACDMPQVGVEVGQAMCGHATVDFDAVTFERADRPGHFHACCALYHPSIHPVVVEQVRRHEWSLQALLGRVRTKVLATEQRFERQFGSVNTLQDLQVLLGDRYRGDL
jgi:molybdopterin-guanine dinucleotide biosynthesis protein A